MSYFEIVNLNKNYDGKEVLKNVNISLPPFGLFGVVGESGSGKSTLLKEDTQLINNNIIKIKKDLEKNISVLSFKILN